MILLLCSPSPCKPLLRFAYPLSGLVALGPLALARGPLSPFSARAGFDAWREHRDNLVRKAIGDCTSRDVSTFELAVFERATPKDVRPAHVWAGLVFILAGSLFYGTVTFRKKTRVLKYW